MPHWKSFTERDYLYAFDLNGQDKTLTIERITGGELVSAGGKKTKKPLCHFKNVPKPLALNATNCKSIATMYGNNTDDWAGKRITIYPTTTQMGGEQMECIRVRPRVPDPPKRNASGSDEPAADVPESTPN